MPNFKYTDSQTRVYDAYGVVVTGRVVQAGGAPDSRWEQTDDKPTAPPEAPVVVVDGDPYQIETPPPAPAPKFDKPTPPEPPASQPGS